MRTPMGSCEFRLELMVSPCSHKVLYVLVGHKHIQEYGSPQELAVFVLWSVFLRYTQSASHQLYLPVHSARLLCLPNITNKVTARTRHTGMAQFSSSQAGTLADTMPCDSTTSTLLAGTRNNNTQTDMSLSKSCRRCRFQLQLQLAECHPNSIRSY